MEYEPPQVMAHPEQWRCIAEEVSEKIDVEPARFYRVRTVRPVYVKKSEPELAPVSAPMPPALLERSIVTPGLLAFIIVNKYCDHRVPRARDGPMITSFAQLHN